MGVVIPQVITEDKADGAQIIDGGLRFGGDTPQHYLTRTTSTPTNAKIFTFSCWFKRSLLDSGVRQFISNSNGANDRGTYIGIESDAFIAGVDDDSTGTNFRRTSSGLIRDSSSWYHLVWVYDTTQSTTDAAIKIYLNGVRFDTTSAGTYSQNYESRLSQSGKTIYIGSGNRASSSYTGRHWNGFMSQVYFIDGQALDPSYFGFTDPLTNTWRPKKLSSSVAFGTNGFYLPFDGNSPIGQDQSGRGNNWTPVNFGGSNTLEKATGALPILNTDGGGKVARVGVRTDSNASSLVLALPLVGIKSDFSNAINSGTSNKAITANGNAAASSAQSNFYSGSFYFDGTGDYLSLTTTSDFAFGTGDFTIEFWAYVPTAEAANLLPVFDNDYNSSGGVAVAIRQSDSFFAVAPQAGGSGFNYNQFSAPFSLNTWNHFAIGASNGVYRAFLNGRECSLASGSATALNVSRSSGTTEIGRLVGQTSFDFGGYLQDLRIYKGLAKYTQNFIPASTDPDILPDTPSGVSYSSNVKKITDGAVAFDGNGDYLQLAYNADFDLGNSNFTIEAYARTTDTATNYPSIIGRWQGAGAACWDFRPQSTDANDNFFFIYNDGSSNIIVDSGAFVCDGSWHHLAVTRSGTNLYMFVDGILVKTHSIGSTTIFNNVSVPLYIGYDPYGSSYYNGFTSNLHIVKGTALYTSNFTPPTAPITSVANTKLLCCKSSSSATTFDVSPGTITANGNAVASNFNPFNTDINTVRGQESGYCVANPLDKGSLDLSDGNLRVERTSDTTDWETGRCTIKIPSTGKWYWEMKLAGGSNDGIYTGVGLESAALSQEINGFWGYNSAGYAIYNGSYVGSLQSMSVGDTASVAFDRDNNRMWVGINGIWSVYGGNPNNGTNPNSNWTNISSDVYPVVGARSTGVGDYNFGQKPFKFPPPDGFQPLALANTPRPTIVRPDQYVGIVTYTGNGGTQSINVGWKPDFVWIKRRNTGGQDHVLQDSVRGFLPSTKLASSATTQENGGTNSETDPKWGYISGVSNVGFAITASTAGDQINNSAGNYVAWAWKAGGNSNTYNINDIGYSTASAAGLTAGTITPTGASVNTKSGFSIITYTGTGSGSDTVPHGLGKAPSLIFVKSRNSTVQWVTYHSSLGKDYYDPGLNTTNAANSASNYWGPGGVTSTVFGLQNLPGGGSGNNSLSPMIAYCWAEIPGFSKFGSYTGNGSSDGPMVVTGFRPRWIMVKDITTGTTNWRIWDSVRGPYNPNNVDLLANTAEAENTYGSDEIDILSNGFKIRSTGSWHNSSGDTYIYAAFAESPSFNLYGGQSNAR